MDFAKWSATPETEKRSQEAKAKALAEFKRKYPNADMGNFTTEVTFDDKNRAMGEVYFKAGPGWFQDPDEVGKKNVVVLRIALGFRNFPCQLLLIKSGASG